MLMFGRDIAHMVSRVLCTATPGRLDDPVVLYARCLVSGRSP